MYALTLLLMSTPLGIKKAFIKGEALRLPRKNSSKILFEEELSTHKTR